MERRARDYLSTARAGSGKLPLTKGDLKSLAAIRNRAVHLAIVSGVISGLIIGGGEIWIRLGLLNGNEDRALWDDPWIWTGFYAVVGLITVVEIVFLYWNALNAITKIGDVVGLAMKGKPASGLIATGLARSALEIPNPHRKIYGIDPYADLPRWRLLLWNLAYKAKVGATSFVMRILLRRVFARAVLRGYVPLLAVPLYAIWNAWITWAVMREARLRALGPSGVDQIVKAAGERQGEAWRNALLHAAGEAVRRGGDAHPTYVLLLARLLETLDRDRDEIEVDWETARKEARALATDDRAALADIIACVTVLAGKPAKSQMELLAKLDEIAGRPHDRERVAALRGALLDGQPFADTADRPNLHPKASSSIEPPPA
ncbi:MAG: LBF_2804 family protein [Aliihoeflea sp.]|uniref:LBF_2804 family protein n=1 Tax=Aliihoeflea sp. TaxID=2608088 RepID=UPI0040331AA7